MSTYSTTPPVTSNDFPKVSGIKQVSESKQDKIQKWFFNPIGNFHEHESFIIMMITLPLYEKYLRYKHSMRDEETFSQGNKIFKIIGKDLKISEDTAYQFWQIFRNGLCHKAMPRECSCIKKYVLVRKSEYIAQYDEETKTLIFNAFYFRDYIKNLIMQNLGVFRNEDYPLAEEYRECQ